MPRHACLGATSACAFSPSPPTHHASPPSPSPCLLLVHVPTPFATHSHTAKPHHHATHTHAWWLVHFGAWCVCVCAHGVGCGRAWLATHTSTHSLCPTPHHSSSCCCCWWWWMWWWQRGCCGVCGHLVHSLAVLVLSTPDSHTHTHGVMGTWWWWLCVWCGCHHHCAPFPPTTTTVCAAPPCPLCVCECEWWHHAHPPTVVPPTLVCVCVSERRGHHTHHPRCRPMCPLSPLTRHATPATLSQMPRLTSLTHTWRALCGSSHPLTHTHWLADCPHALHTPPPLGVRVLIHLLSSATHTHGTHRRGPCMGGCWCGHHHHAPCAPPSHTHTHTAGLVVWAMVVLGGARVPCVCLPRHHHTRLPSHHHHQRSCATTALTHTHGTWCMHHCHTHTPHAPPHTPRRAVC